MDYRLAIDDAPASVPGGTAILLLHPSTGGTDPVDTGFLQVDTDRFLVVSTRTTAREVQQKLEHYEVDQSKADILDTVSVDRGYSRRGGENLHYVTAPDDVDGIVAVVESFLENHGGKRRVSFDSLSELAYYAGDENAADAFDRIVSLLEDHDGVGLFHVSPEVHDPDTLDRLRRRSDGIIEVDDDGSTRAVF
jgi:KaiC/GvpD/RAD55 family RecA-like ATPase